MSSKRCSLGPVATVGVAAWPRHGVGTRLGVAKQASRRVLVDRTVTIGPGGHGKAAAAG